MLSAESGGNYLPRGGGNTVIVASRHRQDRGAGCVTLSLFMRGKFIEK